MLTSGATVLAEYGTMFNISLEAQMGAQNLVVHGIRVSKIMIFTLSVELMSSICYADNNRVWAEQFVGRASSSWDVSQGRTEITEIYLQVVGPLELADEAAKAVQSCASPA
jgi:hypothetical protein